MASIKKVSKRVGIARRRSFDSDDDLDRYGGLDSEIDWEDRYYQIHGYYPDERDDQTEYGYDRDDYDREEDRYDYLDYLEAMNRYDDYPYYDNDPGYDDDLENSCNCEDCQNKENICPESDVEKQSAKDSTNESAKQVEVTFEKEVINSDFDKKNSIAINRKKNIRMSQNHYQKYLMKKEAKKKSKKFGYHSSKILKEKKKFTPNFKGVTCSSYD
jgi:hypothetical protein